LRVIRWLVEAVAVCGVMGKVRDEQHAQNTLLYLKEAE